MQSLQNASKHFVQILSSERNLSPNTIQAYAKDISQFLEWYKDQQGADILAQYISSLKNMSNTTRTRKLRSLVQFFKFCNNEFGYNFSLIVPKITLEKTIPKFLPKSDFLKVREFLSAQTTFNQIKKRVVVEVLYSTGVRISELLNLKIEDLRPVMEQHVSKIKIQGKGSKDNFVYISNYAYEALKAYWPYCSRNTYLFESNKKKMCRQSIHLWIKQLAKEVNISEEGLHSHAFRHRLASDLVQNNMNLFYVQKILGHASVNTTSMYTHVQDQNLKTSMENYHPLGKINKKIG